MRVCTGSPPVWADRSLPFRIPRDRGLQFVDQNAYRLPRAPLLALFRAADKLDTGNVDWRSVDIVTNRNNLRKLLRWVDGSEPKVDQPFRIDVQRVGACTVLLSRWDPSTRSPQFGWGGNFERKNTVPADGGAGATPVGHNIAS